jgi:D-alanyl-D-alanine carboxypeptidase
MARKRLAVALCVACIAVSGVAAAAPSAGAKGFSPKVQRQLTLVVKNNMTDSRLPGAAVGVWAPGRGSYVRAFGIGNRTTGRPARITDHVRIASITKTFTATAILQLVQRGRLSLDDHLSEYVPGTPNGDVITIRQLLNMTSGIFDYTDDDAFAQGFYSNPRQPFTQADFFAILARNAPSFAPGTAAEYCDSNYYLLGLILEKITGRPAGTVITDQIIRPLRLRGTRYPTAQTLPKPFARGYFGGLDLTDPLTDETAINPANAFSAGAVLSTLGDLRRWAKVLATGRLLSRSLQAQRLQTVPFPNPGSPVDISYGLGIFKLDNLLGHNGAIIGYSTAMFYLPSKRATIVVWGNNSTNSTTPTTTIAFELAEILFPKAVDQGVINGTT